MNKFVAIWDTLYFLCLFIKLETNWIFTSIANIKNRRNVKQSSDFRKFLVISYFPPHITGGVYRPLSWAKYAYKYCWEMAVLTDEAHSNPSRAAKALLRDVPSNIQVFRHRSNRLPAWDLVLKLKLDGGFFSALLDADFGIGKVRSCPPNVIIASGPPFANFITAYYIAKKYRKKLILDYRDEWSECPFTFVYKSKFGRYWEKRCLKYSSKIIFTTQSMKEHYGEVFGECVYNKSVVISNGWDKDHAVDIRKDVKQLVSDRKEIIFAGVIGQHTPFALLTEILQKVARTNNPILENITITILGDQEKSNIEEIASSSIGKIFKFEPQIPINEVIERLESADACLIVTSNDFERYIPGKLFYYLASRRPVIVYGSKGESSDIVTELKAGYFIEKGDLGSLMHILQEIVSSPNTKWQNDKRCQWVEEHTRENLAKKFFGILDGL